MNQPTPTTYAEADSILGRKDSRKIAHNTYLERLDAETIGVRLHRTYVVRFNVNGTLSLDSGGWQTVTTKERMNRYLPAGFRLYQQDYQWFVSSPNERDFLYEDGLVIETRSGVV